MNQRLAQKFLRASAQTARPLTRAEALAAAGLTDQPAAFDRLTAQLIACGELTQTAAGHYVRPADAGLIAGEVVRLSRRFCFVRPLDGSEDYYTENAVDLGALPGDLVLVKPLRRDPRGPAGAIVRIAAPGSHCTTGRVDSDEEGLRVLCDRWTFAALPLRGGAIAVSPGQKVRVELAWHQQSVVAIPLSVYGDADSARICADALLDGFGIPTKFPPAVRRAADQCDGTVPTQELETRRDLRDLPILTIDGADAKDLDDAISVARTPDGWALGVHIADVSHYVTARSAIDLEARRRGTSVYFADRVVPMLPESISNGVCSLQPNDDKRAFSALITLDTTGAIQSYQFAKSVIRSRVRGVYGEVNALFDGTADAEIRAKYAPVADTLSAARELAQILRRRAAQRGYMEFQTIESKFTLDADGKCIDVAPRTTGEAEQLIEHLMLTANEAAARLAQSHNLPFVYRTHAAPAPERLIELRKSLELMGFHADFSPEATPLELAALLRQARETPHSEDVSHRLLRAMAKAKYLPDPVGHYGLALADYCHFTSPIRRYADLAVHRILTDVAAGVPDAAIRRRYALFAQEAARLASETEIRAVNAERAADDCYAAEWMRGHLSEPFSGAVSGLTEHGVYVRLENSVEGLLPAAALALNFDGARYVSKPGFPRRTLSFGDRLAVQAVRADVASGEIHFAPLDPALDAHSPHNTAPPPPPKKPKKTKHSKKRSSKGRKRGSKRANDRHA